MDPATDGRAPASIQCNDTAANPRVLIPMDSLGSDSFSTSRATTARYARLTPVKNTGPGQ
jgi:hypothetical protein